MTPAARRSTSERGYGTAHQRERERWEPQVAAGLVDCARCGRRIAAGQPWDLGHTDDRTAWTGPECVGCNRAAGARHGAQLRQTEPTTRTSREW